MSSVRDIVPNRSLQAGGILPGAASVHVQSTVTGAIANFFPQPGGVHVVSGLAAPATYTITAASVAGYDCKLGEGFEFKIKNEDGADTITIAVTGPEVVAGAGTLTIATGNVRSFSLCRQLNGIWRLDSLGTVAF